MRQVAVGFAQKLVIEFLDLFVLVRYADLFAFVLLIKSCGAFVAESVENVVVLVGKEAGLDKRLSAACDATAGASHDFDEVIGACAFSDLVEKHFCILHAGCDRNFDIHTAKVVGCLFDALHAANFLQFNMCEFLAGESKRRRTKSLP